MDRAKRKQQELESRSSSQYHNIPAGKRNWFFLLPGWTTEDGSVAEEPWKEVMRHGMLVCPKATHGKPCPICDRLRVESRKGNEDFVDRMKLGSRGFFNAVRKEHLKDMDPDNVKVLPLSPAAFRAVIDHITEEEIDITEPTAAVPVGIKRKGEKQATRYDVQFGTPTDVSRYVTEDIYSALINLDTFKGAKPASKDELLKALKKELREAADEDEYDSDGGEDGEEDADASGDEDWESYEEQGQDDVGDDDEDLDGGEDGAEEDTVFDGEGETEDGEPAPRRRTAPSRGRKGPPPRRVGTRGAPSTRRHRQQVEDDDGIPF